MNKKFAIIIFGMYTFFVILLCAMGGILKEEWFIDGDEIKNVCDVLRVIVVDDSRGTIAIASLIAISPVVIYGALNKFREISINIMLLIFCVVWFWNFIFKYRGCLWF